MFENINYQEIINAINGHFVEIMNDDYELYKDYKVIMAEENQFLEAKDKDPKAIYIVVRFSQASVAFGQSVLPLSITILGEENKMEIVHQLLADYSNRFNLAWTNADRTIREIYEAPSVINNFQTVYSGFRSLYRINGFFVISPNSNYYDVFFVYTENENTIYEEVPAMNVSFSLSNQPDTQAFYNSHNFTKSEIMAGSLVINFSSFLLSGYKLLDKVTNMICKGGELSVKNNNKSEIISSSSIVTVNNKFKLRIVFRNGNALENDFRIVNIACNQNIGEIPIISLNFTE